MSCQESASILLSELADLPVWRDVVRRAAHVLDVPAECVDAAVLVASELGANALLYGAAPVRAEVVVSAEEVCIRVLDSSSELPDVAAPMPPEAALGGRGMPIVRALAAELAAASTPAGKVVWARITPVPRPSEPA